MKHYILVCLLTVGSLQAQSQVVAVTQNSGDVAFLASDIVQIVGAVSVTPAHTGDNNAPLQSPMLRITFGDGTVVENRIASVDVESISARGAYAVNNPLQGVTLTGVSKMSIQGGSGVVTVRVMKQAAQFVSEPVMLPLIDEGTYTITLETSIDMLDWTPAAPGDYLTATSHRFFRVKAVKKEPIAPNP